MEIKKDKDEIEEILSDCVGNAILDVFGSIPVKNPKVLEKIRKECVDNIMKKLGEKNDRIYTNY